MATSEGWRGKEVKNAKVAPVSIRDEILCLATMPITRSSESICMGWTCSLELGLAVWSLGSITGITQPQLDHPSPHLRNRGLECQGPSVWLPDHCFGPAVDPVTWWAVSEDSPSCSGPVVCRWGRARQVAGCLGRT